jgi:exonuclease SbcC
MQPLSLTIQAFGPFAGKEVIDFTVLGRDPMFLINGPTGAGKSSILDAMCFALYGVTTGNERQAEDMRCDNADVGLLTQVAFTFAIGSGANEKRYRITRDPKQDRPAQRGDGMTEHKPKATVWELDEHSNDLKAIVSGKITDANEFVDNTIGLSAEQFRQVMVLPQGQFRKLLTANTAERIKIFSTLFGTSLYKQIEDDIVTKAKAVTEKIRVLDAKKQAIFESVALDNPQQVATALEAKQSEVDAQQRLVTTADQARSVAEKALTEAQQLHKQLAEHNQKQAELSQLNAQAPVINQHKSQLQRAQAADKIASVFTDVNKTQRAYQQADAAVTKSAAALASLQQTAETAKSALDRAESEARRLPELQTQLANQERALEAHTQLSAHIQAESEAQANVRKLSTKLAKFQGRVDELVTSVSEHETNITQTEDAIHALQDAPVNVQQWTHHLKQRQLLDALQSRRATLQNDVVVAATQRDSAKQQLQASQHSLTTLKVKWHQGQAFALAQQLEIDSPCPVCGSLEHPAPAQLAVEQIVSQDEVEAAEQLVVSHAEVLNEAERALQSAEHNLAGHITDIASHQEALGDVAQMTTEAVQQALTESQLQLSQLNKLREGLKATKAALSEEKNSFAKGLAATNEVKLLVENAQSALALAQGKVKAMQESIAAEYQDRDKVAQATEQLSNTIVQINEAYQSANTAYNNAQTQVAALKATIASQTTVATQAQQDAIAAHSLWEVTLHDSMFVDQADFVAAQMDESAQFALSNTISEYENAVIALTSMIATLASQIDEQQSPNLTVLAETAQAASVRYEAEQNTLQGLLSRAQSLADAHARLVEYAHKNQAAEEEYKVVGTLAKVLKGDNANNVNLETYVLSVLLDEVLASASARLLHMSENRFSLQRKLDKNKGSGKSGLDLEVYDIYSATSRDVATLSGGESFLSALALALGLSDVVQSHSGGIKIDTLFIDEGFGSLDSDSLQRAIDTLADLQMNGRMIGIISHVGDLKEQIPLRIDIHKVKNHSTISQVGM